MSFVLIENADGVQIEDSQRSAVLVPHDELGKTATQLLEVLELAGGIAPAPRVTMTTQDGGSLTLTVRDVAEILHRLTTIMARQIIVDLDAEV